MDYTFIFIAYTVGTLFGLYVGNKIITTIVVERTVDNLIDNGYIKTKKNADGETELLRYNEQ